MFWEPMKRRSGPSFCVSWNRIETSSILREVTAAWERLSPSLRELILIQSHSATFSLWVRVGVTPGSRKARKTANLCTIFLIRTQTGRSSPMSARQKIAAFFWVVFLSCATSPKDRLTAVVTYTPRSDVRFAALARHEPPLEVFEPDPIPSHQTLRWVGGYVLRLAGGVLCPLLFLLYTSIFLLHRTLVKKTDSLFQVWSLFSAHPTIAMTGCAVVAAAAAAAATDDDIGSAGELVVLLCMVLRCLVFIVLPADIACTLLL